MYIIDDNGVFTLSESDCGAVLKINNPKYYIAEQIYEMKNKTEHDNGTTMYADDLFVVKLDVVKENEHLFKLRRTWKNKSKDKIKLQTIFEVKALYAAKRYLIPCVNFNGNSIGNGKEPKGLYCEGRPWIFAYDRMSVPSCSVVESKKYVTALFSSAKDNDSMRSACSILQRENHYIQQVIHPEKEAPYTYASKDLYEEKYDRYLELLPECEFVSEMYIYIDRPLWENFGIAGLLNEVLDMINPCYEPQTDFEKIWQDGVAFAKGLVTECKGKKGFIIGYLPDGKGGFAYRSDRHFQIAWCGQNAMLCRMLILDYTKYGNKDSLDTAIEIMDNWVKNCVCSSGLMAVHLQDYTNLDTAKADTCNLGYGAFEILKVYELLKGIGVEKKEYFNAAKGICDFFAVHYSKEYAFGKAWNMKGECVERGGTIGAFLILPMCEMYKLTHDKEYLKTAEKAMEYYCGDLHNFVCTAGALDTCCVDKETSAPLLFSAIMLYEITGKENFLEYAQKAAYYFTSWMYHYTPYYEEDCDIAKMHIDITGYTAVSVQHHHVDAYAGLAVPYFRKLARYTGDSRWKKRADMMLHAVLQNISSGKDKIHELVRPRGAQNEALFQCRWWHGENVKCTADSERGNINDWLVAWVCAFRLNCISEISEQCQFGNSARTC